jgi:hypothetical protein
MVMSISSLSLPRRTRSAMTAAEPPSTASVRSALRRPMGFAPDFRSDSCHQRAPMYSWVSENSFRENGLGGRAAVMAR